MPTLAAKIDSLVETLVDGVLAVIQSTPLSALAQLGAGAAPFALVPVTPRAPRRSKAAASPAKKTRKAKVASDPEDEPQLDMFVNSSTFVTDPEALLASVSTPAVQTQVKRVRRNAAPPAILSAPAPAPAPMPPTVIRRRKADAPPRA